MNIFADTPPWRWACIQHRIGKSRAEVHFISLGSLLGCGSGWKFFTRLLYIFCTLVLHSADVPGERSNEYPSFANAWPLYASPDSTLTQRLKPEFTSPSAWKTLFNFLYKFLSFVFYSASVSGDSKRRLKKWFDQSPAEQGFQRMALLPWDSF